MEPIKHTLTARIGILRLYREELDQLLAMFQGTCQKVTISDSKFRYSSLDEMRENVGIRVKDLDILGENPGVHFLINRSEVVPGTNPPTKVAFNELRTEEISESAEALFYKVKVFLSEYERRSFRGGFALLTLFFAFAALWFAVHNSTVNAQGQSVVGSFPGMISCFAAMAVSLMCTIVVRNYVSLNKKRESQPFLMRIREDLAKSALVVTISIIISGIIGWLFGHFLK